MRLSLQILVASLSALLVHDVLAKDTSSDIKTIGRALENELKCVSPPEPGNIIREMLSKGLLKSTGEEADGIPVFVPTLPLIVFGKRVTFVSGWQPEADGSIKTPFGLGLGTAPPVFLAVSFRESPSGVLYKAHETSESNIDGSHSTIESGSLDNSQDGSTITCYAM